MNEWLPAKADWERALEEAVLCAARLFASRGLYGADAVLEGTGKSAADIASEALVDALIRFNPALCSQGTERQFFLAFVRRKVGQRFIDAVRRPAVRRRAQPSYETTSTDDGDQERWLFSSQYVWELAGGDRDAQTMLFAVIDLSLSKRQDIADALGWRATKVDAVRKRIARRDDNLGGAAGPATGGSGR